MNHVLMWLVCLLHQLHDGAYSPVLEATFVMVARDPENKRYLGPGRPGEDSVCPSVDVLINNLERTWHFI